MTFQLASDLHLERAAGAAWLAAHPLPAAADVLLLAGDIVPLGMLGEPAVQQFIGWCSSNFAATLWVPGNHEFAGPGAPDVATSLPHLDVQLAPGVRLCNCVEVRVTPSVSVLLTTLWTPVAEAYRPPIDAGMCDCDGSVSCHGRPFTAACYTPLHEACLGWLKDALAASTAPCKIVVTHHCPVPCEDPAYASNGLSAAFVTDLRPWLASCGARHWAFGHTHYNAARGQLVGHCQLHTNQLGPLLPTFLPAHTFCLA